MVSDRCFISLALPAGEIFDPLAQKPFVQLHVLEVGELQSVLSNNAGQNRSVRSLEKINTVRGNIETEAEFKKSPGEEENGEFRELGMRPKEIFSLVMLRHNPWKTPAQIRAIQNRKLRRILHHAYHNVPYYRELFDAAHIKPEDIREVDDISSDFDD